MPNFVIIDVETTQNPQTRKEEIIEFAGIEFDKDFSILKEFSSLINPGIPLSFITKKVTGIFDIHLTNQPCLSEVLPKIDFLIKDKTIIAHNASFDIKTLINAYSSCNLSLPSLQVVDSLRIAKRLLSEEKSSLSALKKKFNILIKGHRAKEDALSVYYILKQFSTLYGVKNGKTFLESIQDLNK